MSPTAFERICAAVCDLVGCAVPALAYDENGLAAFHFTLDKTLVTFAYAPSAAQMMFVVLEFGPAPPDQAEEAWRILMEANLLMMEDWPPAFARDPSNGNALLRLALPIADAEPVRLYQRLAKLAQVARDWRGDPLMRREQRPFALSPSLLGAFA